MRPLLTFAVGDEVVWSSVNHKGTKRLTVEKVGRKLVYVKGDRCPYRISDGSKNDGYAHENIRSLAVAEWDESVGGAQRFFAANGLLLDYRNPKEDWLVWAADVLRAVPEPAAGEVEK